MFFLFGKVRIGSVLSWYNLIVFLSMTAGRAQPGTNEEENTETSSFSGERS